MHSRIFQISKFPVTDFIDESKYYEGFCGSTADYVLEIAAKDRAAEVKSNLNSEAIKVSDDGLSFVIVDKDAHFKPRYGYFIELAQKIARMTYEEYSGGGSGMDVFRTKMAYEEGFGFYVDDNGEYAGLETFDSFMRRVQNGEKYFVGAVFDYHF